MSDRRSSGKLKGLCEQKDQSSFKVIRFRTEPDPTIYLFILQFEKKTDGTDEGRSSTKE